MWDVPEIPPGFYGQHGELKLDSVSSASMWNIPEIPQNFYGEHGELKSSSIPVWTCCQCWVTHTQFNAPKACNVCSHERDEQCDESSRQVLWFAPGAAYVEKYGPVRDHSRGPLPIAAEVPSRVPLGDEPSEHYEPLTEEDVPDLFQWEIEHRPQPPPEVGPGTQEHTGVRDKDAAEIIKRQRTNLLADMIRRGHKPETLRPKVPKIQRTVGFNPEELIRAGILEEPDVKPNGLTGDIHPIFAYDHWYDTPREVYDAWAPSLRLATKFITQPFVMKFWTTLFYGKREPLEIQGSDYLPKQRIVEWVDVTPENFIKASEYLDSLGRNTNNITFTFSTEFRTRGKGIHGVTDYPYWWKATAWKNTPEDQRPERPGMNPFRQMYIAFDQDYYVLALRKIATASPDPNKLLRQYLPFATTIVHELAHALGALGLFQYFENKIHPTFIPDPVFPGENKDEIGWAWEQFIFGGDLGNINQYFSGRDGLCIHKAVPHKKDGGIMDIWRAIPMSWISWIQQQSTWDSLSELRPGSDRLEKARRAFQPNTRNSPMAIYTLAMSPSLALEEKKAESEKAERRLEREIATGIHELMLEICSKDPDLGLPAPDDALEYLRTHHRVAPLYSAPVVSEAEYPHLTPEERATLQRTRSLEHWRKQTYWKQAKELWEYMMREVARQRGEEREPKARREREWKEEEERLAKSLEDFDDYDDIPYHDARPDRERRPLRQRRRRMFRNKPLLERELEKREVEMVGRFGGGPAAAAAVEGRSERVVQRRRSVGDLRPLGGAEMEELVGQQGFEARARVDPRFGRYAELARRQQAGPVASLSPLHLRRRGGR